MKNIDIKSFNNTGQDPATGPIDRQWWKLPKKEIPQALAMIVTTLGQADARRNTQYQTSARLYGNSNLMGVNGLTFSKIQSMQNSMKDRMSYNVIQSTVDAIVAKMAKNKPRPLFLTDDGDYKIQRKAKKLDKFCAGVFYENESTRKMPMALRDAGVFGDGLIHVFPSFGRVKWERTLATELYVDMVEAFYGEPRQLHRVKNIDRQVLSENFPNQSKNIAQAISANTEMISTQQNVADQVTVMESWHLPSGPEATDGLHTICTDKDVLFSEKWEKDFFPFARIPWSTRLYGYWSQSLAEQNQNIQLEINKLLWVIQRSMHLAGSFKILMDNSSKIVTEHLNNDIGAIVKYTGLKPEYVVPPVVPLEYYNHLQNLKQMAFEQAGISMLSAASQKPAGLNSGKALREFNDIESDRFMVIGQQYEALALDLAKLSISVAKDIYEETGKYEVRVPDKKSTETIDWGDIDLAEDDYTMKIFPISALPNEPAGRLETVQEMMKAGLIDPQVGKRLLDFPDLDQIERLANSVEDRIHKVLETIIEDGEYTPPDPYMLLPMAKQFALQYINDGINNGLEEEKLSMLRMFSDQVDMMMKAAMPPPQPVPVQTGPAPAAPMPPPTSDLIPNIRTA